MRIRTRLFLASFGIAAVSLFLAAALGSTSAQSQLLQRIETELIRETNLVAELVMREVPSPPGATLDADADALGGQLEARVTLIAPDGRVVADSERDGTALFAMDNHGARPEVNEARQAGLGISRRFSTTIQQDLLYVAVPIDHPTVGFVRLALPLDLIDDQVASLRQATIAGLVVALGGAVLLAWVASIAMSRRVRTIAAVAERYAAGDLSSPLHDDGRDEIGTVARALDGSVHELGRRLKELSRFRNLIDTILSSMREGVLVVDRDGYVQVANDEARSMLSLGDSPVGRHYVELSHPSEFSERVAATLRDEAPARFEITISTEPLQTLLVSCAALTTEHSSRGVVVVMHDISEFRRVEQIRQDFVANVSHELRTPLTAIRGSVEALVDDAGGDDTRRFVDIIERQTARMERLVDDLLRLARLDAGQERPNIEAASVQELFDGVIADLEQPLESGRHTVETRVEDEAETAQVDPPKLHDVLKNLVANASHYAPEGTVIELHAGAQDGQFVIRVSDRGPGIPEADLVRVFERFYRVDPARARRPGGTGLGLAIVKHLIGLHGGTASAANREGGGTVFTLRMPHSLPERSPRRSA